MRLLHYLEDRTVGAPGGSQGSQGRPALTVRERLLPVRRTARAGAAVTRV